MSGIGKRFMEAGYVNPKPLIQVCGKPIIEHVVSMFPGKHDFVFICNEEHLQNTPMASVLERIAPNSWVTSVQRHSKGPVFAVSQIFDHIKDDEGVMLSYCDYFMKWDFKLFQEIIQQESYDAAVPCYTGFHPHLLRGGLYAGVLTDGKGTMTDIKEKHCFTESSLDCHHSVGAYYFKSGSNLKKYFKEQMDKGMSVNGEFYASTPFELLLNDKLKIYVPEVERFIQLGTPEDLEEFESWMRHVAEKSELAMPETEIPREREGKIAIPYRPESKEYQSCLDYWKPVAREWLAQKSEK